MAGVKAVMAKVLDAPPDERGASVEREIRRDGMAMVYLARDLKHERLVALKMLRPEVAAVLVAEHFCATSHSGSDEASSKESTLNRLSIGHAACVAGRLRQRGPNGTGYIGAISHGSWFTTC